MLINSHMSKVFWQDAVATAVYINNRTPKTSIDNKTPHEIWYGEKPDLFHLKIFGCKAVAHLDEPNSSKLDHRGKPCIMIGYAADHHAYLLWDIKNKKRIVSRNVDFFENLGMSIQQPITEKPKQKAKRKFAIGSDSDSEEDSTCNDTLPVNDTATVEDEIFSDEDMELDESVSIDPDLNVNQV